MVDTTRAGESTYINADIVRESTTKKCVIINEGEYVESKYGEKFQLDVEIDGKKKSWSPSKDTVRNIQIECGKDSRNWVGKIIKLSVVKVNGKDAVLGIPLLDPKTTTETIQ